MNDDITETVMGKIVEHEKRQTRWWIILFLSVMTGLGVIILWFAVRTFQESMDLGTWSMLSILGEDKEIIREYMQQVMQVIWWELPQEFIIGIAIGLILVCIVIIGTARRRRVIKKKIEEIRIYKKRKE